MTEENPMARVNRGISLSRRAFLRGTGACIALPWLDAMAPAFATTEAWSAAAPLRAAFVFLPNGIKMDDWTPAGKGGSSYRLPSILEPLNEVKSRVSVLSGLTLDGARAHGDGPGDHARAAASFLTSAHPVKTGGADIHAGVSVDQVMARAVGSRTRFSSLELGCERGRRAGKCDSGYSCAYSNNVSWRSPSQPVAKETDPRAVFTRLFGDPAEIRNEAVRERERRRELSLLDSVLADMKRLENRLGPSDRSKLDEYLTAVRELEKRLRIAEKQGVKVDLPEGLREPRGGVAYPDRVKLMYELITLAFEADLTRVASFMVGNAGSNRSYRFLSVPEGHHYLSHHGKKAHKLVKIRKINRFHAECFAGFLEKLAGTKEGNGDLLHHSMIVYGSAIGDGNRHNHHDLPILLGGGGKGTLGRGKHLVYPKNTPLANLYLSLLDRMGVDAAAFGDSRGRLL